MEGINGKKRFTVLFPSNNQQVLRFGDCNPNSNDRADIKMRHVPVLELYPKEGYDQKPIGLMQLPEDAMAANGWYDHEHDGFVLIKDFVWK